MVAGSTFSRKNYPPMLLTSSGLQPTMTWEEASTQKHHLSTTPCLTNQAGPLVTFVVVGVEQAIWLFYGTHCPCKNRTHQASTTGSTTDAQAWTQKEIFNRKPSSTWATLACMLLEFSASISSQPMRSKSRLSMTCAMNLTARDLCLNPQRSFQLKIYPRLLLPQWVHDLSTAQLLTWPGQQFRIFEKKSEENLLAIESSTGTKVIVSTCEDLPHDIEWLLCPTPHPNQQNFCHKNLALPICWPMLSWPCCDLVRSFASLKDFTTSNARCQSK